jgi:hypothetical protein
MYRLQSRSGKGVINMNVTPIIGTVRLATERLVRCPIESAGAGTPGMRRLFRVGCIQIMGGNSPPVGLSRLGLSGFINRAPEMSYMPTPSVWT